MSLQEPNDQVFVPSSAWQHEWPILQVPGPQRMYLVSLSITLLAFMHVLACITIVFDAEEALRLRYLSLPVGASGTCSSVAAAV